MSDNQLVASEGNSEQDQFPHPTPPANDRRHAELEELIRQHNEALVNYIYSWVHCRADARDIAQEAFVKIFSLGDPNVINHLRGFLYRTAKNIAADWIRKRIVREAFADEAPLRGDQDDTLTPEHIWLAREQLAAVQRAIELLPARTRMALHMIREDGLSYEEVGAKLGIQTHSARRLIERATEFLLAEVSKERLTPRARGRR